LSNRQDTGAIWENFIIAERVKYRTYHRLMVNQFFWRTYDGSEVDLVEEYGGRIHGYEIKKQQRKLKIPLKWQSYANSTFEQINEDNFLSYIM
jgi:hypothetical protein